MQIKIKAVSAYLTTAMHEVIPISCWWQFNVPKVGRKVLFNKQYILYFQGRMCNVLTNVLQEVHAWSTVYVVIFAVVLFIANFASRSSQKFQYIAIYSNENITKNKFSHLVQNRENICIHVHMVYTVLQTDDVTFVCYSIVMVPKKILAPGFGQWVGTGYLLLSQILG